MRFSQKLPTRYSDCGENHNFKWGDILKTKFFLNFRLLQQFTQCVTTSATLKREPLTVKGPGVIEQLPFQASSKIVAEAEGQT